MESKNLVSIIVPVYNSEKYLKKCIKSILMQTYQSIELILIDDGSTDGSRRICEKLSLTDDRIYLFSKENGGVSSARNLGLKKASGNYIAFIDADDYIDPEYIKTLIFDIKKFHTDIVQCRLREFYPNGVQRIKGRKQNGTEVLNNRFNYCKSNEIGYIGGKLFRKQSLNGVTFDSTVSMSEDALFVAEVIKRARTIYYEEKILYAYRIHESSSVYAARHIPDITVLSARRKIFYMQKAGSIAFYSAGMKYLEMCRRIAAEIWILQADNKNEIKYLQTEVKKYRFLIWKTDEKIIQKILLLLFLFLPDIYFRLYAIKKRYDISYLEASNYCS